MGLAGFGGWNYAGFAHGPIATGHHHATNARTLVAVGRGADEGRSEYVPNDSAIESVEVYLDNIGGGASEVTVWIFRDTAGDCMICGPDTQDIVIGTTTNTDGSVRFTYAPEVDHHRDSRSVNGLDADGNTSNRNVILYVGIQLDAGTANAYVHVNWRSAIAS